MSADALIARLERPRATGRGTWVCRCPAHADKSPSMTVRELDDGRVLVHCFAGCEVSEILGAVGLDFDALFPPNPIEHAKPLRRPFPAADVLEALAHEALVVEMAAAHVAAGKPVSTHQSARLLTAVARIHSGRDLANG